MIQNGILYHSIRESDESPIYTYIYIYIYTHTHIYIYIANRPNMFGFNLPRFHRANSSAGGIILIGTVQPPRRLRQGAVYSYLLHLPLASLLASTHIEASRWSKLSLSWISCFFCTKKNGGCDANPFPPSLGSVLDSLGPQGWIPSGELT